MGTARIAVGTRLRWGLVRRCPRCGHGGLFERWFRLKERCPACGLRFERESGFFVGALFVNLAVTEVLGFSWIAGAFLLSLPHPRATPVLLAGVVVIATVFPVFFYPFSKTIWAAIHLAMEPLSEAEEADVAAFRFERGEAGPVGPVGTEGPRADPEPG
jgi:uncharacterized protein (DUF983 family)